MIWSEAIRHLVIMSILEKIEVDIKVELGATMMPIHHVLRLGRGAVIELDAMEDDPMKIYGNNKQIAVGEIRIVDGGLSIEVTQKISENL